MPLLARRALGLGLGLALGPGCFSEPAGQTSGATEGSDVTGDEPSSGLTVDPDDTGSPSGGGCMGCLDAAGGCLAGDLDQACGALAATCVACGADSFCNEGQCSPLPLCNSENCEGCCDGDDCLAGTELSACGEDGQQCSVCSPDNTCNEGSCELPCDSTCTGCCDASGDCIELESTTADACGSQGETCQGCDTDFACSEGSCISTACQSSCDGCCDGADCNAGDSNVACGSSGLSCQACPLGTDCAGACTASDDAQWQILIISATASLSNGSGDAWDVSEGLPDPYVEVTVAAALEATSAIENSAVPVWDEFLFENLSTQALSGGIVVELWDADFDFDDSMGECTFALPAENFGIPLQASCPASNGDPQWTLQLAILAVE